MARPSPPEVTQCLLVWVLDDALTALAEVHPRMNRVVELRFFGGLSVEELLANQNQDGAFIETSALELAAKALADKPEP